MCFTFWLQFLQRHKYEGTISTKPRFLPHKWTNIQSSFSETPFRVLNERILGSHQKRLKAMRFGKRMKDNLFFFFLESHDCLGLVSDSQTASRYASRWPWASYLISISCSFPPHSWRVWNDLAKPNSFIALSKYRLRPLVDALNWLRLATDPPHSQRREVIQEWFKGEQRQDC